MIVGIGVDVLAVRRMAQQLRDDPGGFARALFTPAEIAECEAGPEPAARYAARFAAKEATFKSLDAADRDGASWREVEVLRAPSGQPRLVLTGRLAARARERGTHHAHVSLTHTRDLAAAAVVLESAEPPNQGPMEGRSA